MVKEGRVQRTSSVQTKRTPSSQVFRHTSFQENPATRRQGGAISDLSKNGLVNNPYDQFGEVNEDIDPRVVQDGQPSSSSAAAAAAAASSAAIGNDAGAVKRPSLKVTTDVRPKASAATTNGPRTSADPDWRAQPVPPPASEVIPDLPYPDVVMAQFAEYLEVMSPLSDEEAERLGKLGVEEKWKIIFNDQKTRPSSYAAQTYVENLDRYTAPVQSNEAAKPVVFWLRKLKVDLKMSPKGFVEEFVSDRLGGMIRLVDVLQSVGRDQQEQLHSLKRRTKDVYQKNQLDEYECLLCIKFAARSPEGRTQLVTCPGATETIANCIISELRKTTCVVVEILTIMAGAPNGYPQVNEAMTNLHLKYSESVRFKILSGLIHSQMDRHFQAVCVRFFNTLLTCDENANHKVYLQRELEMAGFDVDALDTYSLGQGPEFEELQKELDVWRKNYININNAGEEIMELNNRNTILREEIDRLQNRIMKEDKEREDLDNSRAELKEHSDKYREKAAILQDLVARVETRYKELTGLDLDDEIDLEEAAQPLDSYGTVRGNKYGSQSGGRYAKRDDLDGKGPAPPAPPPAYLSVSVRNNLVSRVPLPLLNWTPLISVRQTLFQDVDEEVRLREIDFSDFEEKFELPIREESSESKAKRQQALEKAASEIHFVDSNRAKNMIITKRKTGLTGREIKEAVDVIDVSTLHGEYAELLLKYVPTKEELKLLNQHKENYGALGEAEQFLFQMAQVDRQDKKLSLMAFMGIFDDLVNSVRPQIESIHKSSKSVLNAIKLRKIFEIILAFGNHMNSAKRGYAQGFKVDSLPRLCDVKSRDKKITLLHYLVRTIETHYPELTSFHEEIDLSVVHGVSYQGIAADIVGLRKGIDLAKFELDKQQHNENIEAFLSKNHSVVADAADAFKNMQASWKHVCTFFGENYRTTEPDQLFNHLSEFLANFQKAAKENYKRDHPDETPASTPRTLARSDSGRRNKSSSTTSLSSTPSTTGVPTTRTMPPLPILLAKLKERDAPVYHNDVAADAFRASPSKVPAAVVKPQHDKYVTKIELTDEGSGFNDRVYTEGPSSGEVTRKPSIVRADGDPKKEAPTSKFYGASAAAAAAITSAPAETSPQDKSPEPTTDVRKEPTVGLHRHPSSVKKPGLPVQRNPSIKEEPESRPSPPLPDYVNVTQAAAEVRRTPSQRKRLPRTPFSEMASQPAAATSGPNNLSRKSSHHSSNSKNPGDNDYINISRYGKDSANSGPNGNGDNSPTRKPPSRQSSRTKGPAPLVPDTQGFTAQEDEALMMLNDAIGEPASASEESWL